MNPTRKRRLTWVTVMLLGVALAVALILYALKQNINLYFTPSQLAASEVTEQALIRVGGMVMADSVEHATNSLQVNFQITDMQQNLSVSYEGVLPNLFREGQGVVVQGHLMPDGHFQATQVLAKHDEKYMPPDISLTANDARATS